MNTIGDCIILKWKSDKDLVNELRSIGTISQERKKDKMKVKNSIGMGFKICDFWCSKREAVAAELRFQSLNWIREMEMVPLVVNILTVKSPCAALSWWSPSVWSSCDWICCCCEDVGNNWFWTDEEALRPLADSVVLFVPECQNNVNREYWISIEMIYSYQDICNFVTLL